MEDKKKVVVAFSGGLELTLDQAGLELRNLPARAS